MKCPECGGVGRIHYGEEWCSACNGTGEVQTNEEWRKICSAEEFAEWIATQCSNAVMENTYDVSKLRKKRYWVEWLKKPHQGE